MLIYPFWGSHLLPETTAGLKDVVVSQKTKWTFDWNFDEIWWSITETCVQNASKNILRFANNWVKQKCCTPTQKAGFESNTVYDENPFSSKRAQRKRSWFSSLLRWRQPNWHFWFWRCLNEYICAMFVHRLFNQNFQSKAVFLSKEFKNME